MSCYCIGLTGGIASGKSAVSRKFKQLGCDIIDADIIARQVVEPGTTGLNLLVKVFGKIILNNKNELDRAKLRKLVFNDSKKLAKLNSVLHPLIKEKIRSEVNKVKQSFCIIVIPLLCESSSYEWLDRVLVVDVSVKTQLKRLLKRDLVTKELATKMIKSQCTREKRLSIADDVINNEKTLEQLHNNVESLFRLYKSL